GAGGLKDMGRVMAALRENFAGQMDFGKASAIVKERLAAS
ncbi:MAG: GatB/YqeY domain-containing protein, partial [Alphaproteobacteria bacterium]